nr:MAG TPA: hypothetical protein [Caudoviricetes sp.]
MWKPLKAMWFITTISSTTSNHSVSGSISARLLMAVGAQSK